MSLRMIEIVVPGVDLSGLGSLLTGEGVSDLWIDTGGEGASRAKIVLPADRTETITDLLQQRYRQVDGFRLILSSVEATLPRLPKEKDADTATPSADAAEKGKGSGRVSREELYQDILWRTRLSSTYILTVALSAIVAAIGLVRGQVAVVIGAMVIAPLLGPNVGLALAVTLGDRVLLLRSLKALLAGIVFAGAIAVVFGLVLKVDPSVPELVERTSVGILDLLLAAAAGSAGALAFTTGLPAALIGVMIAVALLPPLVTTGLMMGAGHFGLAGRAAILLATNIVCINLAGVITFVARGIRPRTWWAGEQARRSTRMAIGFWIAMLAVLVFLILVLWE
jgi:uncharacterized hydrophobic protein (TIGR00341 family)